jgi:hypothetical protein
MKAVVYQRPHDITVEEMSDPKIEAPNDAVVRMTTTYDEFNKRIDAYTGVLIKPGMAA